MERYSLPAMMFSYRVPEQLAYRLSLWLCFQHFILLMLVLTPAKPVSPPRLSLHLLLKMYRLESQYRVSHEALNQHTLLKFLSNMDAAVEIS